MIYDHAFTIAFSVRPGRPDGSDVDTTDVSIALFNRLASLESNERLEAVGAAYDTCEAIDPQHMEAL